MLTAATYLEEKLNLKKTAVYREKPANCGPATRAQTRAKDGPEADAPESVTPMNRSVFRLAFERITENPHTDNPQSENKLVQAGIRARNMSVFNPRADGSCGYIAFFAALFPYLKDPRGEISRKFFRLENLNEIEAASGRTFGPLIYGLKSSIRSRKEPWELIAHKSASIMLALQLVQLNYVWANGDAITNLLAERKFTHHAEAVKAAKKVTIKAACKAAHPMERVLKFRENYPRNWLRNSLRPLTQISWMTTTDLTILAKIFNVHLWLFSIPHKDNLINLNESRELNRELSYAGTNLASNPATVSSGELYLIIQGAHFHALVQDSPRPR